MKPPLWAPPRPHDESVQALQRELMVHSPRPCCPLLAEYQLLSGESRCIHDLIARECDICIKAGRRFCRHGNLKGICPRGGPAASCGKELCRRHGLKVKNGICNGCIGKAKNRPWHLVSPGNFDISPEEESPPVYDGKAAPAGKLKPTKLLLKVAGGASESVEPAAPSPEGA